MNKKTFMAATISILLISMVAVMPNVELIKANPIFDVPPIYDIPFVSFISPINGTTQTNQTIIFNVEMPTTWEYTKSFSTGERYEIYVGTVRNVTCILDDNLLMFNNTVYGRDANYPYMTIPVSSNITYFHDAGFLSPGFHNITVLVKADTWSQIIGSYSERYSDVSTTSTYLFAISSIPTVALSLNANYEQSTVPLVFTVNETGLELEPCWIGYSLDNQANVTLDGNITLTDLSEGNHSLVVYANDTFGNMGKSNTVSFTVSVPAPTPNPTPMPSASAATSPSVPEFPTWTVLPLILVVITVAVAASRRRRKLRRKS